MKILLVQAWLGRSGDLLIYPLGLVYLATVLEDQGHELKIFDPNTAHSPMEETARVAREFSPDVVGVSCRNIDNLLRIAQFYYYKGFQQTVRTLHNACGDKPLIVGGAAFSILPNMMMERNPAIDFGLPLEAEESFPKLVEHLDDPSRVRGVYYRENGVLRFTGNRALPDFATLPIPKRHFLDLGPYMRDSLESVGIQTKRGCPMNCAYCVYPHLNGRRWRMRTPESVLEEIKYLHADFGVRRITFADSVVNLPYDYSTRIFALLKESHLDIEWFGYMHVRGITREYLHLCLDSGCKALMFSPDALSRVALKGLRKNITPEDIRALELLLDSDPAFARLKAEWCFFVNPPGENLSGLLRTLWFFLRSKRFFGKRNRRAFINWIRLEPFSAIYQTALEEGVITREIDLLPEDPALLSRTFYSAPHLSWCDPMIMALLRAPEYARRLVGRLTSK